MRSLAVIALLAACTLHVEMDVRSIPSLRGEPARQGQVSAATPQPPASERLPPWKSPQVGVSTSSGSGQGCGATIRADEPSPVCDEWMTLDPVTCHWRCAPMPEFVRQMQAKYGRTTVEL